MARLPDIPIQSWIEDQQAQFQRSIAGLQAATEFREAVDDSINDIPADWPVIGGADTLAQQEEELRRQEEERQRQEQIRLQMEQAQAAEQMQREQERQREEALALQARETASGFGIPSPDDIAGFFQGMVGKPVGTEDPAASAMNPNTPVATIPEDPMLDSTAMTPVEPENPYDFRSELATTQVEPAPKAENPIYGPAEPIYGPVDNRLPAEKFVEDKLAGGVRAISDYTIGLTQPIREVGSKLGEGLGELASAQQKSIAAREAAGLPAAYNPDMPTDLMPSDLEATQANAKFAGQLAHAPMELLGKQIDAVMGDPDQKKAMFTVPIFGPITAGTIVANLAPMLSGVPGAIGTAAKAADVVQYADIAGSLVEAPAQTTGVLGGLALLGKWAKADPRLMMGIAGGLAGAIESALNGQDVTGDGEQGIADIAAKIAYGATAGYTAAAGARAYGPQMAHFAAQSFRAIANAPTTRAAVDILDRAGGRIWSEVESTLKSGGGLVRAHPEAAAGLAAALAGKVYAGSQGDDGTASSAATGLGAAALAGTVSRGAVAREVAEKAPVFYSVLRRELEAKMPNKATPEQIQGILGFRTRVDKKTGESIVSKSGPVKEEEIKWTGLDDWLKEQKGPVTKQQVMEFLDQNAVQVQEVRKGAVSDLDLDWQENPDGSFMVNNRWRIERPDPANEGKTGRLPSGPYPLDKLYRMEDTSTGHQSLYVTPEQIVFDLQNSVKTRTGFSDYKTPGGENYREVLLTLPPKPVGKPTGMTKAEAYDLIAETELSGNATLFELEQAFGPERARQINEGRMGMGEGVSNDYVGGHWDEPNVLAHVRFDERVDAEGKKVLHIDEIQSDWHQAGRKEGYKNPDSPEQLAARKAKEDRLQEIHSRLREIDQEVQGNSLEETPAEIALRHRIERIEAEEDRLDREGLPVPFNENLIRFRDQLREIQREARGIHREERRDLDREYQTLRMELQGKAGEVPAGPFEKTWPELTMKRMIRWAAENGFDRVTWEPGSTHSDRWQTDRVQWRRNPETNEIQVWARHPVRPGTDLSEPSPSAGFGPGWQQRAILDQPETVSSKQELQELLNVQNFEAPGAREIAEGRSDVDRIWKMMDDQPEGFFEPRTEGMKGFYDSALPNTVNKLTKKFGATVKNVDLPDRSVSDVLGGRYIIYDDLGNQVEVVPTESMAREYAASYDGHYVDKLADTTRKVWGVDITPEMRQSVVYEGQPQFVGLPPGLAEAGAGGVAGAAGEEDPEKRGNAALVGAALGVGAVKAIKRLPTKGPWAERLKGGPQIPEGASADQVAAIKTAYDKVVYAISDSLESRSTAKQIRLKALANKAWDTYQKAIGGEYEAPRQIPDRYGFEAVAEAGGVGGKPTARPGASSSGNVSPRDASQSRVDSPRANRTLDTPETVRDIDRPTELEFDDETQLLPQTLDPRAPVSNDRVAGFFGALFDDYDGDQQKSTLISKLMVKLNREVREVKMRHLEQILEAVGGSKEYADDWFRTNEYLAPTPETAAKQEAILNRRAPIAQEVNPWEPTPAERAEVARQDAEVAQRPAHSGYLEEPEPVVPEKPRGAPRPDERLVSAADTSFLERLKPGQRVLTSHFYGSDASWDDRVLNAAIEAAKRAGYIVERAPYEDGYMGLKYQGKIQELGGFSGPAAGAAAGAAAAGQDTEDDDYELPISAMIVGSVLGRRGTVKAVKNAALSGDPKLRMLTDPIVPKDMLRFSERVHDIWRNKIIPKVGDDIAALQGFQNDLAREWKRLTGTLLPANVLMAEQRRFDSNRVYEMKVNDTLKPALHTLDNLGIPDLIGVDGKPISAYGQVDTYLGHRQDIDVAESMGRRAQEQILNRDPYEPGLTADERARRILAKHEAELAVTSEERLTSAVTKAQAELDAARAEVERLAKDEYALTGEPVPDLSTPRSEAAAAKTARLTEARAQADMRVARAQERVEAAKDAAAKSAEKRRAASEDNRMERGAEAEAEVREGREFPGRGGSTYQTSKKYVQDFEDHVRAQIGDEGWEKLQAEVLQPIWEFGDHILQHVRDSGIITETAYKELRERYPHYMPTRIIEHLASQEGVSVGKSLSVTSTGLHELSQQGTSSEAMSYISALLGAGRVAYSQGAKNRVFNAFVGAAEHTRELLDLYPTTRTVVRKSGTTTITTGETAAGRRLQRYSDGIREVTATETLPKTEVSVTGYINGEKRRFAVDKDLGDITQFASPTTIPIITGVMSAFRAGATARNPTFLAANAILDLSSYLIRESSRQGNPISPSVAAVYAQTAVEFLPMGATLSGIAGGIAGAVSIDKDDSALTAAGKVGAGMLVGGGMGTVADLIGPGRHVLRDIAQHEYRGDMRRLLEQGAGSAGGYFDNSARPDHVTLLGGKLDEYLKQAAPNLFKSPLDKEIAELRRQSPIEIKSPADVVRLLKDFALLKPVEALGERIELVPRVAAMRLAEGRSKAGIQALNAELEAAKAAVAAGEVPPRMPDAVQTALDDAILRAKIEGTQAARTTTLDFGKGGTWARTINQIIPFFNVGVQSLLDSPRAIMEHKGAARKLAIYPSVIATAVVAPMYYAEVWNNGTEQRAKDYADVPAYIKDQGLVFMLPEEYLGPAPVDEQGNRHPRFLHWRYRQLAPLAIMTREFMQRTLYAGSPSDANRRDILEAALAGVDQVSPIQGIGKTLLEGDPKELLVNLMPPGLSTGVQSSFNEDTFRGARIATKFSDERASPLSQAVAGATGMRPSTAEFWSRDLGTGYAGMLHGAANILAGKKAKTDQDIPLLGGFVGRFEKGSIGEGATRAQQDTITPSAEKILKANGIDWRPSKSDPEIDHVNLTRTEYAAYQRAENRAVDEAIQELNRDKEWRDLKNPLEKKAWLDRTVNARRTAARYEFIDRTIGPKEWDRRKEAALTAAAGGTK